MEFECHAGKSRMLLFYLREVGNLPFTLPIQLSQLSEPAGCLLVAHGYG